MLFKGVGFSVRMATEQEWMDELETEMLDRIKKRKVAEKIAEKYGQKLEPKHLRLDPQKLESHLVHKAVIEKTIPGKYSLNEASRILQFPRHYLEGLKIRKIISYEHIGRASYCELDKLREELKQEKAVTYLKEQFPGYARATR